MATGRVGGTPDEKKTQNSTVTADPQNPEQNFKDAQVAFEALGALEKRYKTEIENEQFNPRLNKFRRDINDVHFWQEGILLGHAPPKVIDPASAPRELEKEEKALLETPFKSPYDFTGNHPGITRQIAELEKELKHEAVITDKNKDYALEELETLKTAARKIFSDGLEQKQDYKTLKGKWDTAIKGFKDNLDKNITVEDKEFADKCKQQIKKIEEDAFKEDLAYQSKTLQRQKQNNERYFLGLKAAIELGYYPRSSHGLRNLPEIFEGGELKSISKSKNPTLVSMSSSSTDDLFGEKIKQIQEQDAPANYIFRKPKGPDGKPIDQDIYVKLNKDGSVIPCTPLKSKNVDVAYDCALDLLKLRGKETFLIDYSNDDFRKGVLKERAGLEKLLRVMLRGKDKGMQPVLSPNVIDQLLEVKREFDLGHKSKSWNVEAYRALEVILHEHKEYVQRVEDQKQKQKAEEKKKDEVDAVKDKPKSRAELKKEAAAEFKKFEDFSEQKKFADLLQTKGAPRDKSDLVYKALYDEEPKLSNLDKVATEAKNIDQKLEQIKEAIALITRQIEQVKKEQAPVDKDHLQHLSALHDQMEFELIDLKDKKGALSYFHRALENEIKGLEKIKAEAEKSSEEKEKKHADTGDVASKKLPPEQEKQLADYKKLGEQLVTLDAKLKGLSNKMTGLSPMIREEENRMEASQGAGHRPGG